MREQKYPRQANSINLINSIKYPYNNKKIVVEKIADVNQPFHPHNMPVGFRIKGYFHDNPRLGEKFWVLPIWATSRVANIIDENTFETLNSRYKWEFID